MSGAIGKLVVAAALVAGIGGGAAQAAPVLTVGGYLRFMTTPPSPYDRATNYFDPANGYVPSYTDNASGYQKIPVDSNVEFGFDDGINLDTANIIGTTQVVIQDVMQNGAYPFRLTLFTNRAHFFDNATFTMNDFGGRLRINKEGNGLFFYSPELVPSGSGTRTAIITFGPISPGVPEPATWGMMVLGFGAIGAAMRRSRASHALRLSYAR